MAPLTQNEDGNWSWTTSDLHYKHFHKKEMIFLLSKRQRLPRSVKSTGHNLTNLWRPFSIRYQSIFVLGSSFPWRSLTDWCDMNLRFVKMARARAPHTTPPSLSSSQPNFMHTLYAVSTIFKTRTHQLMWRMAERKSFFCVGDDNCVFISRGCRCSSHSAPCLPVKMVTQQPSPASRMSEF